MRERSTTHQQRWRARLRETHERFDVYLPKASAAALRRGLSEKETISGVVARLLEGSTQTRTHNRNDTARQQPASTAAGVSPETWSYATIRATHHGVSVEDFLLAAMRGISSQTAVMIKGLAKAGRRDAYGEGCASISPTAEDDVDEELRAVAGTT